MADHEVNPSLEFNGELGGDRTPEELREDRRQLANSSESITGVSIFKKALGIIEFQPDEVIVRVWRTPMVPTMRLVPIANMSPLEVIERTEWAWTVAPSLNPDGIIRGEVHEEAESGYEEQWEYGVLYYLLLDESLYTLAGQRGTYRLRKAY